MKIDIQVVSDIARSPRVMQVEGMFDVPPSKRVELAWSVDLPVEERPWNVGLIVGPSGCGKTTMARHLFGQELAKTFTWNGAGSLLDDFPASLGIKDIVGLLSSVGFSSPPSWVRPFHVLSNGEQFRVTLARMLAELPDLAVVDEFTSVVDRTVAQIGSCALAKTVRRRNQKFVAVTCHEDVEEWLQPDWVYRPAEQRFAWRSLQRRPEIPLVIHRVVASTAWKLFKRHHYLTSHIHAGAVAFVAFWNERPVAFDAWLPFVGRLKDERLGRRGHRTVCLPDYQGCGIGAALFATIASMWTGLGYRSFSKTGHPAEIAARLRSDKWKMTSGPSQSSGDNKNSALGRSMGRSRATTRLTASFEYVGTPMPAEQAKALLASW